MMGGEPRPFRSKLIQIRRYGLAIPIGTQNVAGVIVGNQKEEIGLSAGLRMRG